MATFVDTVDTNEIEKRLRLLEEKVAFLNAELELIKKYQISDSLRDYLTKMDRVNKFTTLITVIADEESLANETAPIASAVSKIELIKDTYSEARKAVEKIDIDLEKLKTNIENSISQNSYEIFDYSIKDNEVIINSYIGFNVEELIIPSLVKNYPVVKIGADAFCNCKTLKTVILPNKLKIIGKRAFKCSGLTKVILPSTLEIIEEEAFSGTNIAEVNIPNSVTNISDAFSYCGTLKSVILPSRIEKVLGSAFLGCFSLDRIDIPISVVFIGAFAFYGCSNLKYIRIPKTVTIIGAGATIFDHTDCTIYCNTGSAAMAYARKHSISIDRVENFPEEV
jgi:hypothetical protein